MRKLKNEELDRLTIKEFKNNSKTPIIIVLDNVRSMNNIGSVFRTGDAFMISGIYLCGITAKPPNKEIHKTALGATESVDWKYFEKTLDAIVNLRQTGYKIVSVEQVENSTSLVEMDISKKEKYAIVLGHEVKGIQQEVLNVSDIFIEIPQYGTKHSLNISVCAGIVIWEFFKKMI